MGFTRAHCCDKVIILGVLTYLSYEISTFFSPNHYSKLMKVVDEYDNIRFIVVITQSYC